MIKGVIFDLDGIITDTAESHFLAWKALADMQKWKFDREINEKLRGVSRLDSIKIIAAHNALDISESELIRLGDLKNELYVQSLDAVSPKDYLPGAEELLIDLQKASVRIALGSASKNAEKVLTQLDARKYFDAIGDGNSVTKSKPAPDIFLYSAKAIGLSPNECLVYEDAESGVDAALAGGFQCVGIGPKDRVGHATFSYASMKEASFAEISQHVAFE